MPIIRLLTDTNNAKDKLLCSVVLNKPISGYLKGIAEKTKIRTPDLWSVQDNKKAENEKVSKRVHLKEKLDPKVSFEKQGLVDKGFLYVKKKGAPANDPAAELAASKAAASPPKAAAPEPEPEPEAPPPPPPPAAATPVEAVPPPAPAAVPPPAPVAPPAPAPAPVPAAAVAAPTPPPAAAPPAPPAVPAAPVAAPVAAAPVAAPTPQPAPPAPAPEAKEKVEKVEEKAPPTPKEVKEPKERAPRSPAAPVAPERERERGRDRERDAPRRTHQSDYDDRAGSAVQAFIAELSGLGDSRRSESEEGEKLGAIMSELSAQSPRERAALRELGRSRSRSPMSRWAQEHHREPAANAMLEVAGLIETVERGPLPRSRAVRADRPLSDMLHRIGLEKYEAAFADADFDYDTALASTEQDLKEIGVNALGARRRILAEIERVKTNTTANNNNNNTNNPTTTNPVYDNQPYTRRSASPPQQHFAPQDVGGDAYAVASYPPQPQYPAYAPAALPQHAARVQEEVERSLQRDKDLERRWEEVCVVHHGRDSADWDRRWDAARRFDYHEMNRWRAEAHQNQHHTTAAPLPSRHAVLKQRLQQIQEGEGRHGGGGSGSGHWQTYYTAEGVPYYYNRETNTTQWHAPRQASPLARSRSPRQYQYVYTSTKKH